MIACGWKHWYCFMLILHWWSLIYHWKRVVLLHFCNITKSGSVAASHKSLIQIRGCPRNTNWDRDGSGLCCPVMSHPPPWAGLPTVPLFSLPQFAFPPPLDPLCRSRRSTNPCTGIPISGVCKHTVWHICNMPEPAQEICTSPQSI